MTISDKLLCLPKIATKVGLIAMSIVTVIIGSNHLQAAQSFRVAMANADSADISSSASWATSPFPVDDIDPVLWDHGTDLSDSAYEPMLQPLEQWNEILDPIWRSSRNSTATITEMRHGCFRVVEFLGTSNYPRRTSSTQTANLTPLQKLQIACATNNLARVQEILQTVDNQYEMISQIDEFGETALHHAVSDSGNLDMVRLLLDIAARAGMLHHYIAMQTFGFGTALDLTRLRNGNPFDLTAIIELLESYGLEYDVD